MNRLAITGMGLVDNLGNSPEKCFEEYMTGPIPIPVDGSFSAQKDDLIELRASPNYNRLLDVSKLSLHTVAQAMSKMPYSENVFTLFSTLTAGNTTFQDYGSDLSDGKNRVKPRQLLQGCRDFTAGYIAQSFGFTGGATSFNSACATSIYQLDYVFHLAKRYDYIVCGAGDSANNLWDSTFFNKLGVLGSKSAPFDDERNGIITGEGAGCLILMDEVKAYQLGAPIIGYIYQPGIASDGIDADFVNPSSSGLTSAMSQATLDVDKNKIGFVTAHATGTLKGDESEYNAIQKLFPYIDVVGLKCKLGHTMAGNGIIELIYSLMALKGSIIPKTFINKTEYRYVTTKTRATECKYALKNSLGFGGKAASVLMQVT